MFETKVFRILSSLQWCLFETAAIHKSENKFGLHKSENKFGLHKSENECNPNPSPPPPKKKPRSELVS